eukprot:3328113-Rhodomonas_salina.2
MAFKSVLILLRLLTAVPKTFPSRSNFRCSLPRAYYAMYGTDIAYDAICVWACYAISGTKISHGVVRLRACYAMSGTDKAYGAIRLRAVQCPVLTHPVLAHRV